MKAISAEDIIQRIRLENPWWEGEHSISQAHRSLKPRAYFELFFPLVKTQDVRRAIVLMGPRRVGKTVLIHHVIQALLKEGAPPHAVCYFSVDNPIYSGLRLEQLLDYYGQASGRNYKAEQTFVFFDEIQYLRQWEIHLKAIVDSYPNIKATASGSAAAALRLKSEESGAGRFTDFLLPPLTFYEYLDLLGQTGLVQEPSDTEGSKGHFFTTQNIDELNSRFLDYLNFGGYPEVIVSPQIQEDPARFIKSDIIEKVLLRDLPSLYGIGDIQELNYLFTTLAFNTASEISLGELSKNSGVAKNTIKRYIEYLQAAFLIKIVHRVGHNAKRFNRANFFKVYLTNPSMRAALFSPLKEGDKAIAALAETAIFAQWFHSEDTLHYSRWKDGEVDLVMLSSSDQSVLWAVEVKWSDRYCAKPEELKSLINFCRTNNLTDVLVTSKTRTISRTFDNLEIPFLPASLYCYTVGYNLVHGRKNLTLGAGRPHGQNR